ncbi:MAG TPA: DUF4337 family protein [Acidisphaera sp.]|nr:DUF4337 family protein [Acidisphaera sp.]
MDDGIERAQEGIEHAHHHAESNPSAKYVAVLIAVLAAMLAIFETSEKSAQSAYLAHHISLSDDWAFFQAKDQRATARAVEAETLASLPNASDPAVQQRIEAARKAEALLRDDPEHGEGMKQLRARAEAQTELREASLHRYHGLETVVGMLQIAIVLASVSIVTSIRTLAWVGGGLGALAVIGGVVLSLV